MAFGCGPRGTSGSFAISESTSLLIRIQRQSKTGTGLYICSFKSNFSLKCSCLPLRFVVPPFKVNRAQRLRGLRIEYPCWLHPTTCCASDSLLDAIIVEMRNHLSKGRDQYLLCCFGRVLRGLGFRSVQSFESCII